jgi:hypothetical protein
MGRLERGELRRGCIVLRSVLVVRAFRGRSRCERMCGKGVFEEKTETLSKFVNY